jgi:ABC-type multidrug transport system permease subunit
MLAFGLRIAWAGLLPAAALLLLGAAAFSACGLALTAAVRSSKAVTAAGLAILLPVPFFSDVFPSSDPPAWMGTVGSLLPMKHLANGLLAVLDPGEVSVDWTGVAVLTAWLAAGTLLSWLGFDWSRAEPTGRPFAGRSR